MNCNLLISVIIPVYNTAPWLPRCLDSLIHQTYRNMEIICVDDGSTDNSLSVLQEYAARDSRIKVIDMKNSGVSAARNRGLEVASGEIIGFCDADDAYKTDALQYVVDVFQSQRCGMVVTGFERVFINNETLSVRGGRFNVCSARELQKRMLIDDYIMGSVCNKFFAVDIIRGLKFDKHLTHCEDMHMVSQVLQRSPNAKVCVSPEVTYEYHACAASATRDYTRLIDQNGRLRYVAALDAILDLYPRDFDMWLLVRSRQFCLIVENIDLFRNNHKIVRKLALSALCYVLPYIVCRKRYPLRQRIARVIQVVQWVVVGH